MPTRTTTAMNTTATLETPATLTVPAGDRLKPAKPKRRAKADKNLTLVGEVWYFRREIKGEREEFSLHTSDRAVARDKRDAHLAANRGKTVGEILAARRRGDLSPIESAITAFVADRRAHGARDATLNGYAAFLALFAREFPERRWQTLKPAALDAWVRGRYTNPVSADALVRHIRAFITWASLPSVAALNNPELLAYRYKKPLTDTVVDYLTVAECRALLLAASCDALPAILLGMFAGIRPDEVARLDWRAIDWAEKAIHISARVSKTREARNIADIPDALWRHLAPYADKTEGPVCPWPRKLIEEARADAKLTRWPHDALRHTFATYYCAQTGNPGLAAGVLGHSNLSMLKKHYNGVAKKSDAAAFFAL